MRRGAAAGAQELAGMRLEGDRDGTRLERACPLDDAREQEAVAEVNAIVVSNARYGGAVVGGEFVGRVEDLHWLRVRWECAVRHKTGGWRGAIPRPFRRA